MKKEITIFLFFVFIIGCSWSLEPITDSTREYTSTPLTISQTTSSNQPIIESTLLPSLLSRNAKDVLSHFVMNNGGCEIPCLMGLIPGADNESAISFSNYFISNTQRSNDQIDSIEIIGHKDDDSVGTVLLFWENHIRVQVGIGVRLQVDKKGIDHVSLSASVYEHFTESNGVETSRLLQHHPNYDNLLNKFSLPSILTQYGEPTEIWIYPTPEDIGYSYNSSAYPFIFVLFYKTLNFAIEYISIVKDDGEYLIGCPNVDNIRVSSWINETKQTINEFSSYFSGMEGLSQSNVSSFVPLQTATSLTIRDFYSIYKANNLEDQCVQTSKELWK